MKALPALISFDFCCKIQIGYGFWRKQHESMGAILNFIYGSYCCWHILWSLVPIKDSFNAVAYLGIVAGHVLQFMTTKRLFFARHGQQDNVVCHSNIVDYTGSIMIRLLFGQINLELISESVLCLCDQYKQFSL